MNIQDKLKNEIKSFQTIWKDGFKTGYNAKRNQKGIEEYLKKSMRGNCCLEIGCGRGQWSKAIYDLNVFDKIYCIDVLSAEHNNFWEYVGNEKRDKIEYIQVTDFNLSDIPDNCLDYVFSYDVFCHISYSGQEKYISELYNKCKINCELCIMYADVTKYLSSEPHHIGHVKQYIPNKGEHCKTNKELIDLAVSDRDGNPSRGRWYWVGMEHFTGLCSKYNYTIIYKDLNIDKTNPLTLFKKI